MIRNPDCDYDYIRVSSVKTFNALICLYKWMRQNAKGAPFAKWPPPLLGGGADRLATLEQPGTLAVSATVPGFQT